MQIRFLCPSCECPGAVKTPAAPSPLTPLPPGERGRGEGWRCPACEHLLTLWDPQATTADDEVTLHACAVCGNHELYKKKGFPHWLGLSVLTVACVGFLVLNYFRLQWWAWGLLIGSAVLDGLLYLAVRDVAVCYRCGAQHGGIGRSGNSPFELTIHERYRQERIRLSTVGEAGGGPTAESRQPKAD